MNVLQTVVSNEEPIGKVRIQRPNAKVIESELKRSLDNLNRSLRSLEEAQQITQDCLLLEVRV